ncbi:hypothetical protein [Streptomyces adustus]|uniref:hypothetical protein n=1 Tax=Streptomyces adustus TaxID=1609272 RepID=UPI003713B625
MWTLPDATARRFPLIARPRPACLPLPDRIHALTALAATAAQKNDPGLASTVHNQAALLACDLDLPGLARTLCHRHATAQLQACPLPAAHAIRALEPVVNLARLHIRAGHPDEGRQQLLDLRTAVRTGTTARLDDIVVPAELTATADARHEVCAWLWRVLIADATRTYTAQGRWTDALTHLKTHHGIGTRMLDGRQVAVLTALTTGDTATAGTLLDETATGQPWEQAVTACLALLQRRVSGQPADRFLASLATTRLEHPAQPGITVFDVRLGLTVLDTIGPADPPAARRIADALHSRTTETQDGYAARENLTHPLFCTLATDRQTQDCQALVHACRLGTGTLPDQLREQLTAALRTSDDVIRTRTSGLGRPAEKPA